MLTLLGAGQGQNTSFDADAQLFFTASGITDTTQKSAINTLVIGLKANSLWTKMRALYPFVGGTAGTHKWNLKDPRDLDAAYRLVFNGGWTHSSTGAIPNGTSGYVETFLTPSSSLTVNSVSMSFYYRTNNTPVSVDPVDMGCFKTAIQALTLTAVNGGSLFTKNLGSFLTVSNTSRLGLYTTSKINSTDATAYKNSVPVVSGASGGTLPTLSVLIGTIRVDSGAYAAGYNNNEFSFAHIGDGLTDTDVANLYTLVQAFQTTLGRQV